MNKKKQNKTNSVYKQLQKNLCENGADLFGVADLDLVRNEFILEKELLESFSRAVVLGVHLSEAVLQEIKDHPTKLYFHHYKIVNYCLDQLAFRCIQFIQRKSFKALAIPASSIVDWQTQRGHLSHKRIAVLAGLGWIGRNNLLVNPIFGSQLRLVTILTDMPLAVDKPLDQDCGVCKKCVSGCPAGAIKETPQDFNHIGCFEMLKEFQRKRLVDQYICGVCVKACGGKKALNIQ